MMKRTILSLLFGTASMFAMAQNQTVSHVVQRGETIESIAEYYNVSVEDIDKANPNMDGVVYVGLKLTIPTNISPKNETKTEETTTSGNSSIGNTTYVSQSSYTTSKSYDNETTLGFQFARIKATYLFPTEIEKSSRGHYRSSYNLSFVLEGEYVFNPNIFAGFGLGYMAQGSCNSDRNKDGHSIRNQQYETQYHYVMVPLSIGYRMPITRNVNFDAYTGPVVTCVVAGYTQNRTDTSEEWNKTKLKDMKKVKYFTPFWNIGARIKLWSFELGAEYWHLLTKTNEGGSKGAIAAYFALHI